MKLMQKAQLNIDLLEHRMQNLYSDEWLDAVLKLQWIKKRVDEGFIEVRK